MPFWLGMVWRLIQFDDFIPLQWLLGLEGYQPRAADHDQNEQWQASVYGKLSIFDGFVPTVLLNATEVSRNCLRQPLNSF